MSLILDALRKSERARQQTLTGQVSSVMPNAGRSRLPVPWITVLGLILALNAVVLAFLFWRADRAAPVSQPAIQNMARITVRTAQPQIRPLAEEVQIPAAQTAIVQPAMADRLQTAQSKSVAGAATVTAMPTVQQSAAPLDTLPQAFQQSLPALHLDVHSYASNPAERFVVINMQRYVVGDTLKEGPRVLSITPQGVILEYQGTRFLLPRN